MKHFCGVAMTMAVMLAAMAGSAHAQGPSLLPGEVPPQRETEGAEQLPEPPPDRFSACVGITDHAKRAACNERETEKRNPATETVPKKPNRAAPTSPPER